MLHLQQISAAYGNVRVLHGVDLEVKAAEVVALLGRNGAGKTTVLKTIMGLVRPSTGQVCWQGLELHRLAPHRVAAAGVAYVPQGRRLFPGLSVAENLQMGLLAGAPATKDTLQQTRAWVLELFPALCSRLDQAAGTLSGGQQQMVAMARALCARPGMLLLDEPTEGLQPSLVDTVISTVLTLKARGVGILLVEQKVEAALAAADRVVFLDHGVTCHSACVAQLRVDPSPLVRYVGVSRG